jgi:hypothetical protein
LLRSITSAVLTLALATAFTLMPSAPANAAGLTISGTVTSSVNGPMDNVCITVGIPGSLCWTATNAAGAYSIDLGAVMAPAGSTWTLFFIRAGYDTATGAVVVNGDETLNMTMSPTAGVTPPATVPPRSNVVNPPIAIPTPDACGTARSEAATETVYLPNITKTLGGSDGWQTPFIVQNVGAAATDLEVSYYRFSDGECIARQTKSSLLGGTSAAYSPNTIAALPGEGQFSVVVKSFGSKVVSVVNEHNQSLSATRAEAMSYNGFASGATSVYLPNITRRFGGWQTPFIIQNLGTVATTAVARFTSFNGTAPEITVARTIEPGRSKFVDPNAEVGLMDGTQYSVSVTASQQIAVVVNTHNDAPTAAEPVAMSANGISSGASSVYGAYAAKNSGPFSRFSTIIVQNIGTSAVTPTISFRPLTTSGGSSAAAVTITRSTPLAPNSAWAFDPRNVDGIQGGALCGAAASTGCLANGEYSFVASATGGTIAAAVNVHTSGTAMGYTASAAPADALFLPNVTRALGGVSGWTTPIVLQSVTATGATIEWRRFSDGGLVTTQTVTLPAGAGIQVDPRNVSGLTDNTQYAVTVRGTGGTISAIVVELASAGDNAMIYEGFAITQ